MPKLEGDLITGTVQNKLKVSQKVSGCNWANSGIRITTDFFGVTL